MHTKKEPDRFVCFAFVCWRVVSCVWCGYANRLGWLSSLLFSINLGGEQPADMCSIVLYIRTSGCCTAQFVFDCPSPFSFDPSFFSLYLIVWHLLRNHPVIPIWTNAVECFLDCDNLRYAAPIQDRRGRFYFYFVSYSFLVTLADSKVTDWIHHLYWRILFFFSRNVTPHFTLSISLLSSLFSHPGLTSLEKIKIREIKKIKVWNNVRVNSGN